MQNTIDKKKRKAQNLQDTALLAFRTAADQLDEAAQVSAEVAEEARLEAQRMTSIQVAANEDSRKAAEAAERMREFFQI